MKMIFNAFAKKLFGLKYERMTRTLLISLVVFWGLYLSDFRIMVSPSVLYLTVTAFTGGVMWQALSSKDQADYMQNMLMLPFDRQKLVFSYTVVLGAYAFLTKTVLLLAVLLAVSEISITKVSVNAFSGVFGNTLSGVFGNALSETFCDVSSSTLCGIFYSIFCSILCAALGILTAAALFTLKKYRYTAACFWSAVLLATIVLFGNRAWFLLMVIISCIPAFFILLRADGYSFGQSEYIRQYSGKKYGKHMEKEIMQLSDIQAEQLSKCSAYGRTACGRYCHCSVWRYLFRYLAAHKNYLLNTAVMWGVACVLPLFFRQLESLAVIPVGFAILSLNTPICILLSCDPALEQAVRFLPGQGNAFCLPYCAFIFLCNLTADSLFLISWQCQIGGITILITVTALFFALAGAVGSVLLEWFFPIRNWKIESDLWHHPRKYVIPTVMLLLAGISGMIFWG